jgi:hypothetical protein
MKIIKLKPKDKIKFVPITERWGRAEFEICPVFKYGYLREIWIVPRQQEIHDTRYLLEIPKEFKTREFSITAWTHKNIDLPDIWRNFWCKEHKTICFETYVPNNTNVLTFEIYHLTGVNLRFDKED